MRQMDIAPVFKQAITFPDVDAATIAAEDKALRTSQASAWDSYMRKILHPSPRRIHRTPSLRLLQAGCF